MMGLTTHIRTAVATDMPHLISLAEIEWNMFKQETEFSPEITERFITTMIVDPGCLGMVIVDKTNTPFGFLSASLDHLDLSADPVAIVHHWFVHNPQQMYGTKNYGLEMLKAFEDWAKMKRAHKVLIGMRMDPGQRRAYDRVFSRMGFNENYIYYSKGIR